MNVFSKGSFALVFPDHRGRPRSPFVKSLFRAAREYEIPILYATNGAPHFDEFNGLIWFHNKAPTFRTRARLGWWMCDLRAPGEVPGCPVSLDWVFLSNKKYLDAFASFYHVRSAYVPPCGIDDPMKKGRNLATKCLFIGRVPHRTRRKARPDKFHANRFPILQYLQRKGVSVQIISRELHTVDQKWLYNRARYSLAISPQVEGYTSNRLYNIISSRGFCLTLWFPGLETLFENHRHLVWFKTAREAHDLIQRYDHDPKARDAVRAQGHELYMKRHTAIHRILAIRDHIFD